MNANFYFCGHFKDLSPHFVSSFSAPVMYLLSVILLHTEPVISIEADLPSNVSAKYGEEVTMMVEATTNSTQQLKYRWYKVKGGMSLVLV